MAIEDDPEQLTFRYPPCLLKQSELSQTKAPRESSLFGTIQGATCSHLLSL